MPRMPHNNRLHTGESLDTHDVWSKTIGYDPYAATDDAVAEQIQQMQTDAAKDKFNGIMQLARLSGNTTQSKNRGMCKTCGGMGHMTFQCRNAQTFNKNNQMVSSSDSEDDIGDVAADMSSSSSDDEAPVQTGWLSQWEKDQTASNASKVSKKSKKKKRQSRSRSRSRDRSDHNSDDARGRDRRSSKKSSRRKSRSRRSESGSPDSSESEDRSRRKHRKKKDKKKHKHKKEKRSKKHRSKKARRKAKRNPQKERVLPRTAEAALESGHSNPTPSRSTFPFVFPSTSTNTGYSLLP